MARPKRSSELRATLPSSMGTRGHEMSKRERAKRNRPQEPQYKHVVNIRHLQNGIGIAGALGIVSIFAYLALDPGPPSAPSAVTNRPSGPEATNGNAFPSGATGNLLPSLAPSSVSPAPSSLSASPSSPMRTNNRAASLGTIEVHFSRSHGNKHSCNARRDDTTSSRHTKQYDAFDPTARHGTVIDIDTGITNDNDISNDIEHDSTRNDGPCQNG